MTDMRRDADLPGRMSAAPREPSSPFHSVTLEEDKCVGCAACVGRCPADAIRLRAGRASVIGARCIDCGECIRTCRHGARKAVSDPLSMIVGFRRKVALPAPALYGQFEKEWSVDRLLSGLLELGFDEVFDVAEAARLVTGAARALLAAAAAGGATGDTGGPRRPFVSSACPAVVRIMRLRFPSLLSLLVPLLPPMEVAARIVKDVLHRGEEGVGVFFISPCAGKVSAIRSPLGYARSALDGVIGLKDIHLRLREAAVSAPGRRLARGGRMDIEWARSGGESDEVGERRSISVDGIANVVGMLEELESGSLDGLSYIEALACPGGCVGGPLAVVDPFIARSRLREREDAAGAQPAPAAVPAGAGRLSSGGPAGAWPVKVARLKL